MAIFVLFASTIVISPDPVETAHRELHLS